MSCALLMACSDGAATTQPAANKSISPGARKPSADVSVATTTAATVIYACYVPGKGTMYRIKTADTPAECDKKDVQMSWTERSDAIPGVVFAGVTVTLPGDGLYRAACPDGKSVLNFGYELGMGTPATSPIFANRPGVSQGRAIWGFRGAAGATYVFYWTCVAMETVVVLP